MIPTMISKQGLKIQVRFGQGVKESNSVEALILYEILTELKKQNRGKFANE